MKFITRKERKLLQRLIKIGRTMFVQRGQIKVMELILLKKNNKQLVINSIFKVDRAQVRHQLFLIFLKFIRILRVLLNRL